MRSVDGAHPQQVRQSKLASVVGTLAPIAHASARYHAAVSASTLPPRAVIEAYGIDPDSIEPLAGGLINQSFAARLRAGQAAVLQRVNRIFSSAVNDDIDAVTRHVEAQGLITPRLIPTQSGRRCLQLDGEVWRLLTRISGETYQSIAHDAMAGEAGRVLGAFHAALADYSLPLANDRPGVHDLSRHLGHLHDALKRNRAHAAIAPVSELAAGVFELAAALGPLPDLPQRLVHGDPKIANVVFAEGRGVCLVDLDTIARMPVPLEMGDALRSWCNLAAEDSPDSRFSLERFRAAIRGYRAGAGELLDAAEWRAVPAATVLIAVELAARFAADSLNESYFAWDRDRFPSASEHNRVRAAAQLSLAYSLREALPGMREIVMTQV
jgi:Ser/Thr protein kinase RdoA (MazF antagonist)